MVLLPGYALVRDSWLRPADNAAAADPALKEIGLSTRTGSTMSPSSEQARRVLPRRCMRPLKGSLYWCWTPVLSEVRPVLRPGSSLGFPTGISGMALMARAYNQAQKFGVDMAIPIRRLI